MPNQRRTRLEEVIGRQLKDVAWADLELLVEGRIQEDQDLEFKLQHYGRGDNDKQELAKDVAAFANTTGGVLIIGIEEDNQGCASSLNPVSLEEGQVRRYHEIVASHVKPLIAFSSVNVATPDDPSMGAVLLVVERSGFAPHAANANEGLRYPRRHGRSTLYLREHEVASAYRERMVLAQSRVDLARAREKEFLANLDPASTWLVMSLVPDFPGHVTLDQSTFAEFQSQFAGQRATVPWYGLTFSLVRVRHRRIYASDYDSSGTGRNQWCGMELHTDGSGCYAVRLGEIPHEIALSSEQDSIRLVSDGAVVSCVISGLERLGKHAWTSGAQGMANVQIQVWPVGQTTPIALARDREVFGVRAGELFSSSHPCEVSVPLEDLGQLGTNLIETAAVLLQELAQSFGIVHSGYLSSDGRINIQYWDRNVHGQVRSWCAANNIEITESVSPS
ncbi:divergent AAA domain protein [mine drainage metagenome]|uniref:Divergent AAA domain protein n=1 Tax=mine drainage metagenome TaxID=410659 RepID=A0A1J5QT76_9ZZZZ